MEAQQLQAAQLQNGLTPFIMAAFEAAHARSRIVLNILFCMLHVLTDVCSRRARRLRGCSSLHRRASAIGGVWTLLSVAFEQRLLKGDGCGVVSRGKAS